MRDPTPDTAAAYFGGMVDSYDSLIRRAVPRYDEMTDRLIEYLPPSASRLLELGCGTGNLTLRLAERFPTAIITAVDASPEMTEVTRRRARAAGFESRLKLLTARFEDLSLPPDSADLVASCMSLHHVVDKAALYRNIHSWLGPKGTLRFADQFLGATDSVQAVHWEGWLRFCRQEGHCSPAEIDSLIEHSKAHDHYTPLPEHFSLLRRAGFTAVDCVWRTYMYAVAIADR